ncbi:MAG: hypothetical protein K9M56_02325 [Victivallales bacterium]|nr:hypothetical protein [Victivallales bacterium]
MSKSLFLFFLSILFSTTICYSADKMNDGPKPEKSELSKAGMKELSEMDLSEKSTKRSIETDDIPTPEKKKSQQFWDKKLENPILEKAMQKKNEKKTPETDKHSILHKIVLYFPNRLIDLTDIITLKLGFGPQASLELTFTKWFEFGGSYGDNYFIEKGYNRQYGGGYHGGYNISGGWVNRQTCITDYTFGTVRNYIITENKKSLIPCPCDEVYQDGILDFWKIGIHAGWLANAAAAVHPVAIANFFTGFFFVRLTDTEEI